MTAAHPDYKRAWSARCYPSHMAKPKKPALRNGPKSMALVRATKARELAEWRPSRGR